MVVGYSTKVFHNVKISDRHMKRQWRQSSLRDGLDMHLLMQLMRDIQLVTASVANNMRVPQISSRTEPASSMCHTKQLLAQHRLLIHGPEIQFNRACPNSFDFKQEYMRITGSHEESAYHYSYGDTERCIKGMITTKKHGSSHTSSEQESRWITRFLSDEIQRLLDDYTHLFWRMVRADNTTGLVKSMAKCQCDCLRYQALTAR